jgi:Gpi18-like mannosyltransferase
MVETMQCGAMNAKTAIKTSFKARITQFHESWTWQYLLFPFLVSRLGLILVAWFGRYFADNPHYANYIQRGYFLSPKFLIDIWSRWDAEWYLSIVKQGFVPAANLPTTPTNLAFSPLYPWLVRLLTLPFNLKTSSVSLELGVGLILSNLFFLGAGYLLYKLVKELIGDEVVAQRTLLLLIAFPAGFFFSTFYTESLFLLLMVASIYLGYRQRWIWAAVLSGLGCLAHIQGILVLVPLLWMYLAGRGWKVKALRVDVLSFLIPPVFLLGSFAYLYSLTGDFLAYFHAQAAWGRMGINVALGNIFQQFSSLYKYQFRVDFVIYLVFIAAAIYALAGRHPAGWKWIRPLGLFSLLTMAIPLITLSWVSLSRLLVIIFPVFIILGYIARKRELYLLMLAFFIDLQAIYFLGWTSYYFIA